jgi:hypothetical protein
MENPNPMNDYTGKLVDSSRLLADILVRDIGNDPLKFAEMLNIAFLDEYPVSMRAARIISLVSERNQELIEPYIPEMTDMIIKCRVDGVKRSFLKILAESPVQFDETIIGKLTGMAFDWIEDPKQAIAVRYYCIEIILKIAADYPEIGMELAEVLKNMIDETSSGLKSKSRKVLKYLARVGISQNE